MAVSNSISIDSGAHSGIRFVPLVISSLLFHALVLVIIPLATTLIFRPKKYARPQTFQLVRVPPPKPKRRQKAVKEKAMPKKKKKHVPRSSDAPAVKQEPEENLDELASLLEELPVPASVMAPSGFKWDWYIMNVQQKIERNWQPPTGDRNLTVDVAFTIFHNGAISAVKIKRSSGNGSLDNMAVRAVKLAAPFGKLPPGYSGNKLDLRVKLIPVRR
jgi:protein TonB